ncbi:LisH domain-containing protein armc9, partial [Characodon lateralis]|nr:LisH domain-containing protein armc9 [Characodon lateralis]
GSYVLGFVSASKIPRTPDPPINQNSAHRNRGPALAPQFSQSEPQHSSRPGSASSTGGRGSGGRHSKRR